MIPIFHAFSPLALSRARALSTSGAGRAIIIPTPQLKVRYISWRSTLPAVCSQLNTSGHCRKIHQSLPGYYLAIRVECFPRSRRRSGAQWHAHRPFQSTPALTSRKCGSVPADDRLMAYHQVRWFADHNRDFNKFCAPANSRSSADRWNRVQSAHRRR